MFVLVGVFVRVSGCVCVCRCVLSEDQKALYITLNDEQETTIQLKTGPSARSCSSASSLRVEYRPC